MKLGSHFGSERQICHVVSFALQLLSSQNVYSLALSGLSGAPELKCLYSGEVLRLDP